MSTTLSLTWSEGITKQEADIFAHAVHQTLNWLYFRRVDAFFDPPILVQNDGNWVIPSLIDASPYWGTQWYIDVSYDRELDRVVAPAFLELVQNEPWQKRFPHLDLALLDEDLTDMPAPLARRRKDYYSLGTSYPERAAVISVYRLRTLDTAELRALALTRLVQHHIGHLLAVPPYGDTTHTLRRGLETHCTHRCAMRHAETIEQLQIFSLQEAESPWPFCPRCTAGLHSAIISHGSNWN